MQLMRSQVTENKMECDNPIALHTFSLRNVALPLIIFPLVFMLSIIGNSYQTAIKQSLSLLGNVPVGEADTSTSKFIKDQFQDNDTESQQRLPFGPKCDIYSGKWVYDETYPLWNPFECPFVSKTLLCQTPETAEAGRNDSYFRKFRWQPHGCSLPRFNASSFRELMQNKRLVLVGDSLGNNQWHSLVGMTAAGANLSRVTNEPPPQSIVKFRKREMKPSEIVYFEEHNFTIEFLSTKYLIFNTRAPKNTPPEVKQVLRLNEVHWNWPLSAVNADVLVFNAGHWFNLDHTYRIGRFPELDGVVYFNKTMEELFRTAMETVANWADQNVDQTKTKMFFRSFSPLHERFDCPTDRPRLTGNLTGIGPYSVIAKEVITQKMRQPMVYINVTDMSYLRPDGKIGPLSDMKIDCSHWCTPGVPDVWNELLFSELLRT